MQTIVEEELINKGNSNDRVVDNKKIEEKIKEVKINYGNRYDDDFYNDYINNFEGNTKHYQIYH